MSERIGHQANRAYELMREASEQAEQAVPVRYKQVSGQCEWKEGDLLLKCISPFEVLSRRPTNLEGGSVMIG